MVKRPNREIMVGADLRVRPPSIRVARADTLVAAADCANGGKDGGVGPRAYPVVGWWEPSGSKTGKTLW